jgi:hypothetical protein
VEIWESLACEEVCEDADEVEEGACRVGEGESGMTAPTLLRVTALTGSYSRRSPKPRAPCFWSILPG